MTLSLAMIVKNNETTIEKCLLSCYTLFDEIIIVDTGSTDKTKEICQRFTHKIYDFEWCNDFAKARNFSFDMCTSDYIMWLDSDDIVTPENLEKLKYLDYINKEIILLKYNYCRDEFGVPNCIFDRERIVKRSLNLKWQKRVHEYIPLNGKVSREDISIEHYKQQSSSERNLAILEEIIKIDKDPRNFYYLGREYSDFNKHQQAIVMLEKFVKMNGWWEDVFTAHEIIAKCYLVFKNDQKYLKNIFKSIEIEPTRAEPYYSLGEFYASKQSWKKAIHYFEQCLSVKRSSELLSTYCPQYYTYEPALWLCDCYNKIGDVQKSYEYNELFLKLRPNDKRGVDNRSILYSSPLRRSLKDGENKKLQFGGQRIPNYVNADITKTDSIDEIIDMTEILYKDNSISSIHSEHSIGRLSFDKAKEALKEFFRVLKSGGELNLYIPDLELCCLNYLNADNSRSVNYIPEKKWYRMTIYGPQMSSDTCQFRLSGYSKTEIIDLLEEVGFIIDIVENY